MIEEGKIIGMEILEHNETSAYYKKVMDSNYIDKLINSVNVNEVDTVSGATITSSALKKMVINTMEDYNNGGNYER